jgi:hypothetical protein
MLHSFSGHDKSASNSRLALIKNKNMAIKKSKNKMLDGEEIKNKEILGEYSGETEGEAQQIETPEIEFFFPGSGEYRPITIKAKTRAEAEAKWVGCRVRVNNTEIKENKVENN